MSARLLAPVIRGGPAGRRQLMLIVYPVFLLLSSIEVAFIGNWNPRLFVVRTVVMAAIVVWFFWRPRLTDLEWFVLAVALPLLANLTAQLAVGWPLSAFFAANIVVYVAVIALVFDPWILAAVVVGASVEFAAVQYHYDEPRAALVGGGTLLAGLVVVVTLVRSTATSLRASYADLRASHAHTVELHQLMATAADDERRRIAADLHDDTVQVMAAAAMQLDGVRRLADAGDTRGASVAVERARETIDRAIQRTSAS